NPAVNLDAPDATIKTIFGADLNRNFPAADWGRIGTRKWPPGGTDDTFIQTSRRKETDIYCGNPKGVAAWGAKDAAHTPVLEKETEALTELTKATTGGFRCRLDIHSYLGIVAWTDESSRDATKPKLRPKGSESDFDVMKRVATTAA